MKTDQTDHRDSKDHRLCDYGKFKRLRFFHGMLLDDKDFHAEQTYHINKRRLLNRALHGWGVVCGLEIEGKKGEKSLKIKSGLALDCCGREVQVCEPYSADLSCLPCPPARTRPSTPADCEELEKKQEPRVFYVAVCYHEAPTHPVPVYVAGGGCDERSCDYSRVTEGFCVKFLEHCCRRQSSPGLIANLWASSKQQDEKSKVDPEHHRAHCADGDPQSPTQDDFLARFYRESVPCSECPDCCDDHHCVILGKIQVDECNRLEKIWVHDCRTYVWTGPMLQYLFHSLFSGVEHLVELGKRDEKTHDRLREKFLEADVLASNPIAGICWMLEKLLLEKFSLRLTEKGKLGRTYYFDRPDEGKSSRSDEALKSKLEEYGEVIASYEKRSSEFEERWAESEKRSLESEARLKKSERTIKDLKTQLTDFQKELKILRENTGGQ